eukprot:10567458-Alexandrium_andersonii.AAC.1
MKRPAACAASTPERSSKVAKRARHVPPKVTVQLRAKRLDQRGYVIFQIKGPGGTCQVVATGIGEAVA